MSMRGPPSFSQTISSDLDQAVGSAGLDCRQTRASKETPIPAILPGLYVISGFMAMSRISCMEP